MPVLADVDCARIDDIDDGWILALDGSETPKLFRLESVPCWITACAVRYLREATARHANIMSFAKGGYSQSQARTYNGAPSKMFFVARRVKVKQDPRALYVISQNVCVHFRGTIYIHPETLVLLDRPSHRALEITKNWTIFKWFLRIYYTTFSWIYALRVLKHLVVRCTFGSLLYTKLVLAYEKCLNTYVVVMFALRITQQKWGAEVYDVWCADSSGLSSSAPRWCLPLIYSCCGRWRR